MKRSPPFLPILLIVVGGVLTVRALAGVQALPQMLAGARAWAEEAAPIVKPAKPAKPDAKAPAASPADVAALLAKTPPISPQAVLAQPKPPAPAVCAPTPAELARQAGMSPNELLTLQSLGSRRTQLDAREQSLEIQLQLLAAAEAKVDGKLKQLTGLKGDIQGLLGVADTAKAAEMTRLVTVYEKMKPAEAAARMSLMDDSVRLPLASKMKISALSAVLGQMTPADAKMITEKLADRLTAADRARQAIAAATAPPGAAAPATPAGAKPSKS